MGRRPVDVDLERVEQMAREGATETEIADVLGVSRRTLGRKARGAINRGIATFKAELRRVQVAKASEEQYLH
jgi:uncharacterized protein YerC